MTRSDGARDPARRLAGLNGRVRRGAGLLTAAPPRTPSLPPPPAVPPRTPRVPDPPTVPLLLPGPKPSAPSGPGRGRPVGSGVDEWSERNPRRAVRHRPGPSDPGDTPDLAVDADIPGAFAPHTADPDPDPDPDPGSDYDAPEPGTHGARPPAWRRVALRWLPPSLAGARVDPGRPGALALVVVVLLGSVVAGVGVWANRPTAQPVTGLPAVTAGPGTTGPQAAAPVPAAPASAGPLVVSVVGRVARPGLVRVPDGSRVADAVDAAGGALPGVDLAVLNLARRLGDGEQIAIGVPPAADAAPVLPAPGAEPAAGSDPGTGGAGSGGGAAPGAKVDLNSATVADLDALPGIGPVTAAKILDWRTRNGRFSRVEQLREVDGIGEGRFAKLKDAVRV